MTFRASVISVLLVLLAAARAAGSEVVITEGGLEPRFVSAVTWSRVDFRNATGRPVHLEFPPDPRQHEVFQAPGGGPLWAVFHRPGTHPYIVHVYGRTTTALQGVVVVTEDASHRWDSPTCGVLVLGECIEP
jgi:hypothetical protein